MICIHAGHAPDGMQGCGAAGNMENESSLNRRFLNYLASYLRTMNIPYQDSTVNVGDTASKMLKAIVSNDRKYLCSLGISIHFNTSANHNAQGTEIYTHTASKTLKGDVDGLCRTMADALGVKNRGVKKGDHLYYCYAPTYPTLLIEVAFCDNMTQDILGKLPAAAARLATWIGANYRSITGKQIPGYEEPDDVGIGAGTGAGAGTPTDTPTDTTVGAGTGTTTGTGTNSTARTLYRVQVGAFADPANATRLCEELARKGYQAMVTKVTTI